MTDACMSTSGREVREALKVLHDFNQIQAFVFDEAHLVEQEADCREGDSYYREYEECINFIYSLPQSPRSPRPRIIATTATATPRMREIIRKTLRFDRTDLTIAESIYRPNLELRVIDRRGIDQDLEWLVDERVDGKRRGANLHAHAYPYPQSHFCSRIPTPLPVPMP